jgi:hypothetical protein
MGKVSYAVFRQTDETANVWEYVGAFTAHSAEAAEKAACDARDKDGEYAAVALSSWTPQGYEVVSTRSVRAKKPSSQ